MALIVMLCGPSMAPASMDAVSETVPLDPTNPMLCADAIPGDAASSTAAARAVSR